MARANPNKPRRVLVVEDEYMIAQDMAYELQALGAEVVGPVGSLEQALRLIESEAGIDIALLDLNLNGARAYPLADALLARGARVVFTTGYEDNAIPAAYVNVPRCGKPVTRLMLRRMLEGEEAEPA